jgi:hypothetical protein
MGLFLLCRSRPRARGTVSTDKPSILTGRDYVYPSMGERS